MHDALMTLAALAMVGFVCLQGVFLLAPTGKAAYKAYREGAYRDPTEAKIQALEAQVRDLQEKLALAEYDRRLRSPAFTPRRVATMTSLVAVCCLVLGHASLLSSDEERRHPSHAAPTMLAHITSGGEVTLAELKPRISFLRARALLEAQLAFDKILPGYELAIASILNGDRPWVLWIFPKKQGRRSMVYALN